MRREVEGGKGKCRKGWERSGRAEAVCGGRCPALSISHSCVGFIAYWPLAESSPPPWKIVNKKLWYWNEFGSFLTLNNKIRGTPSVLWIVRILLMWVFFCFFLNEVRGKIKSKLIKLHVRLALVDTVNFHLLPKRLEFISQR